MKRFFLVLLPLLALALSCARAEYDISEGVNTDVTLFSDEIVVPVGSIGPITIGSTLGGVSKIPGMGDLLSNLIKQDSEGNLYMEDSGSIFKINVYELEKRLEDPTKAQVWNAGYQSKYIGGMIGTISLLGFRAINQKVVVSVLNPIRDDVAVTSSASYNCLGGGDAISNPIEQLNSFTMESKYGSVEKFSLQIPESVSAPLTSIAMNDLSLSLPANPASRITDDTGNVFFSIDYVYTSGIAVGSTFSLPLEGLSLGEVSLPIGKYKAKRAEVKLEVVNTIPLSVTVKSLRAMLPSEDEEEPEIVDGSVEIQTGFTIAAGSIDNPTTSTFTVSIEALEDTIPDINKLQIDLEVNADPRFGTVPIHANQSIFVKSASARLSGGITLAKEE